MYAIPLPHVIEINQSIFSSICVNCVDKKGKITLSLYIPQVLVA